MIKIRNKVKCFKFSVEDKNSKRPDVKASEVKLIEQREYGFVMDTANFTCGSFFTGGELKAIAKEINKANKWK